MSALDGQCDERRAKIKESPEYQKSLKDAEKKFIDTYNQISKEKRAEEDSW